MATFGTFTAGQVLTAGELNAAGAYSAHTVTYTNVTLGNGTSVARYTQFNKIVHYYGRFTLGTTSAITGQIGIDLPVNANTNTFVMGNANMNDFGVATIDCGVIYINADLAYLYPLNAGTAYAQYAATSATVPFTWGNQDFFTWNLVYEAA